MAACLKEFLFVGTNFAQAVVQDECHAVKDRAPATIWSRTFVAQLLIFNLLSAVWQARVVEH